SARCSQIGRKIEAASRFQIIAFEPYHYLRPAAQPSNLRANSAGGAGCHAVGERATDAVGAGIAASAGPHMQGLGAVVAFGGLESRTNVVTLRHPTANPGVKSGIARGELVNARGVEDLDIVDQTFAFTEH